MLRNLAYIYLFIFCQLNHTFSYISGFFFFSVNNPISQKRWKGQILKRMFYGIQFEEEHLHQTHGIITLKSDISHIYGVIVSVIVRRVKKPWYNWIAYACTLCVLNSAVTECGKRLVCAREEGCGVPACMVKHVNECQKIFHNSAHTLEQQFRLINAIGTWERPGVITNGSCRHQGIGVSLSLVPLCQMLLLCFGYHHQNCSYGHWHYYYYHWHYNCNHHYHHNHHCLFKQCASCW